MNKALNKRRNSFLAAGILALVLIAAGWVLLTNLSGNEGQSQSGRLTVGSAAPDFQAVDMEGEKVPLSDYRGKVVVLNFWASWCGPCVNEMPLIDRVRQSNIPGMEVLYINVGESKGTVREFLTLHKFNFPALIDATGKLAGLYKVTGLPVTYVLDPDGDIARVAVGEIRSEEQFQAYIDAAKED
ncbi:MULTISPECIES: TlpA family protein disulfide reductase [Paenibacillus]|uniref:TlpA family protein disulfide reductase n=1 Tax=Paenibacillus TaxID=44249 RepID=UPI002FE1044E